MEMEKKKKMKQRAIVLYPSPGRAHLNPVVELAKLILKEDPSLSITIITSSLPPHSSDLISYASKVSTKSIHFVHLQAPVISNTITTAAAAASSDLGDTSLTTREYVASLFEIPRLNNPAMRDALLLLSQTYDIRAFIMDFFCYLGSPVASSLDLPTYYLRSSGAFFMAILLYLPSMDKSIVPKSLQDLDPNFLVKFPTVPPIPCKDMAAILTDRVHRVYHHMGEASTKMAKCNGLIANTFDAFEPSILKTIHEGKFTPRKAYVPPVYCVGPLVAPTCDAAGEDDIINDINL